MNMIKMAAFFDELNKIARVRRITEGFLKAVESSKGALGKAAVPKSVPKTLKIGPGGVQRLPHVSTMKQAA